MDKRWVEAAIRLQLSLANCDLSDMDLSGTNLSRANLSWANLSWANLSRANLSGANLSGANLIEATLSGANLSEANLSEANLSEANLIEATLIEANLSGANLSGANLSGANLSEANLSGANLSEANLSGATGLLSAQAWLFNFETDAEGVIVFKAIGGTDFCAAQHWNIAPGSILEEVANPDRCTICGCGVNFGTLEWVKATYRTSTIWRCRIAWMDLAGVVVPYNTDGKARCERLTLLEIVE